MMWRRKDIDQGKLGKYNSVIQKCNGKQSEQSERPKAQASSSSSNWMTA
jgi:hypothetical protein